MAEAVSGSPATTVVDVHVTGRRVVATLVDGLLLGLLFAVMSLLFGSSTAAGGQVHATLNGLPFLVYLVLVVAYYVLMEGYLGQTVGKMILGIQVVR
jgi:uncharacterized RDD family membrane protein YckC